MGRLFSVERLEQGGTSPHTIGFCSPICGGPHRLWLSYTSGFSQFPWPPTISISIPGVKWQMNSGSSDENPWGYKRLWLTHSARSLRLDGWGI